MTTAQRLPSPSTTPHPATLTVITPDGRRVAADVTGPDDGPVVVLLTAAPGSRRFDPDPGATAAAGVRLVTVDRPGYGASDPVPDGRILSVADAADDVALVLDTVGVAETAVVGWSAGGRVAVALAARRPDLTRRVAVVATPAPHEDVPWIPDELVGLIAMLRAEPATAVATMEQMMAPMAADAEAGLGSVSGGPADEALLAGDDGARRRLVAMLTEAFVQGAAGMAADIASYTLRDWGFDARAVGAPVRAWYGEDDAVVGPAHGRWWVDQVADGSLEVVPGAGHLVVVPAWRDVLAWAAPNRP
jgi:pimeloyl-ACP methyl ester carboxylesterase